MLGYITRLHWSTYTLEVYGCYQFTEVPIFYLIFFKVAKGLENFLFKLVILRSVKDHSGNVWRREPTDMYVIEITTDKNFEALTVEDDLTYNKVSVCSLFTCHNFVLQ